MKWFVWCPTHPKMSTSQFLQPVNMSDYMAKGN